MSVGANKKKQKIQLSELDKLAIAQAVYGEGAGADESFRKMVTQTMLNRIRSGKKKEFGANVPEMLQRGYYAVSNANLPYKQALSGKFPDVKSKARFAETRKLVDSIVADEDFGEALFYFTEAEEKRMRDQNTKRASLKKPPVFNFSAVKPAGIVSGYRVYGY